MKAREIMTQPVVTVREGSALDEVARTLLEHRIGGVPVVEVVLFQIIHIGNYRSETKSALRLSPFRSPFLLWGSVTALLVHVAAMHLPLGQRILGTEPVSLTTWIVLYALALTIFIAMEIHGHRDGDPRMDLGGPVSPLRPT